MNHSLTRQITWQRRIGNYICHAVAGVAALVGCDGSERGTQSRILPITHSRLGGKTDEGSPIASAITPGVSIRKFPIRFSPPADSRPLRVEPTVLHAAIALPLQIPADSCLEVQELLHYLRAFGAINVEGHQADALLPILLDSRRFDGYYKQTSPIASLLTQRRVLPGLSGFQVRTLGGKASIGTAPHHDKYFQVMGELGLSSQTTVYVDGQLFLLEDGIRIALADFNLDQELEFSAVAFAHYLPPVREWENRHGARVSFDMIASELVNQRDGGACYNIHRLYALTVLLRANDRFGILEEHTASRAEGVLLRASSALERRLNGEGLWPPNWDDSLDSGGRMLSWQGAIAATGHHLEWIALAPPRLRPNQQIIQRAASSLASELSETDPSTFAQRRAPLTYCSRALLLLTGKSPANVLGRSGETDPGESGTSVRDGVGRLP